MKFIFSWVQICTLLLGMGVMASLPAQATEDATETLTEQVTELDWEALIPKDWNPVYPESVSSMQIDFLLQQDPDAAQKFLDEIYAFNASAPVVKELDGKLVKLPGFILPLDFESTAVSEFLLVPYVGACIHVPPPPANQMVYGKAKDAIEIGGLYDPVWITGKLNTTSFDSELGAAGYAIEVQKVDPYEW